MDRQIIIYEMRNLVEKKGVNCSIFASPPRRTFEFSRIVNIASGTVVAFLFAKYKSLLSDRASKSLSVLLGSSRVGLILLAKSTSKSFRIMTSSKCSAIHPGATSAGVIVSGIIANVLSGHRKTIRYGELIREFSREAQHVFVAHMPS